jgi:hypothetical protein
MNKKNRRKMAELETEQLMICQYADLVDELQLAIKFGATLTTQLIDDKLDAIVGEEAWRKSYRDLSELYKTQSINLAASEEKIKRLELKLRQETAGRETWYASFTEERERSETLQRTNNHLYEDIRALKQQVSTIQNSATVHMNDAKRYELEARLAAEQVELLKKEVEDNKRDLGR